MARGHGGTRPGSGRKPGVVIDPKPIIDLMETIESLPGGAVGRQRRCALALASFGADDRLIAAALAIEPSALGDFLAADVHLGRIVLRSNIRNEMMRAALGRGRPFSVSAAKTALRWLEAPEVRR